MWTRLFLLLAAVAFCCACNVNIPPTHARQYDVCAGDELALMGAARSIATDFGLVEDERHVPKSADVPVAIMFSSPERGELVLSVFYFRGRLSYRTYESHMDDDENYEALFTAIEQAFESASKAAKDGAECLPGKGE